MKSTERFKQVIFEKLQQMAEEDPVFAEKMANPNKNIDDCITYILNTVKKSECAGFTDDEIFGMAAHYYDEENVEVGKLPSNMNVVVNHHVELTEEEIQEAKEKALDKVVSQEVQKLHKGPATTTSKTSKSTGNQQNLF